MCKEIDGEAQKGDRTKYGSFNAQSSDSSRYSSTNLQLHKRSPTALILLKCFYLHRVVRRLIVMHCKFHALRSVPFLFVSLESYDGERMERLLNRIKASVGRAGHALEQRKCAPGKQGPVKCRFSFIRGRDVSLLKQRMLKQ